MIWLLLVLFAGQFETTFRAGLLALNENNLTVAESQLETASQLQPRDPRVWLALAQTYRKLHKSPAAETAAGFYTEKDHPWQEPPLRRPQDPKKAPGTRG